MAWDEWMDEWMDGMDLVKSTKNGWRIAVKTLKKRPSNFEQQQLRLKFNKQHLTVE